MPVDDTYPIYPGNTQDETLDTADDVTVANAADYNVHDRELLAHQVALKGIQEGTQIFPDLKLADGGKLYLNEAEDTYIIFNTTAGKIEVWINGEKIGHLAVSS